MIQAQLDILKEKSAEIVIQYTNGYIDSKLRGTGEQNDIFEHCLRLHYLWGIVDSAFLVAGVLYIGDTIWTGEAVEEVYHKIWHYNGIYADVDLSDYSDITSDDGDGGITEDDGDGGTTVVYSEDHFRVGEVAAVAGSNVVTFYKNGVASPLPSSNYQVNAWVVATSGYIQRNLVVSTQVANGFTVIDVLYAGTLYYQAIIDS